MAEDAEPNIWHRQRGRVGILGSDARRKVPTDWACCLRGMSSAVSLSRKQTSSLLEAGTRRLSQGVDFVGAQWTWPQFLMPNSWVPQPIALKLAAQQLFILV